MNADEVVAARLESLEGELTELRQQVAALLLSREVSADIGADTAVGLSAVPAESDRSTRDVSRRGLIAGAAGALGLGAIGIVASASPAAAGNGQAVTLGAVNTETSTTTITAEAAATDALEIVSGGTGRGLYVFNTTAGNDAIQGQNAANTHSGAAGFDQSATGGNGVYGASENGFGVRGISGTGAPTSIEPIGVYGYSDNGSGVAGVSANASAGDFEITNTANSSPAVYASSAGGTALRAVTSVKSSAGVYGEDVSSGGGMGVEAYSAFGTGLYASAATGDAVVAESPQGSAGDFSIPQPSEGSSSNTNPALSVETAGTGFGLLFNIAQSNDAIRGANLANSKSGVAGFDTSPKGGNGVYGSSSFGFGTVGTSEWAAGVRAISAEGNGLSAISTKGAGGAFIGGRAAINLTPTGVAGAPSSGLHQAGDIVIDKNGAMYLCTATGTPGTWVVFTVSPA